MVVLLPGLTILIFVSSQTGFSVHSRYVIPALPFFFVWMSKVGRVFERRSHPLTLPQRARGGWGWLRTRRQPALAALVAMALAWSVGSSLSIYPHSLSYFNELAAVLPTPADAMYAKPLGESRQSGNVLSQIGSLLTAGPRNGPRHLLDSNIDWGQDLFYLKDWLDAHPEAKFDGLAVWGSYPATLAGIPETRYPPAGAAEKKAGEGRGDEVLGPQPGWYAVSVNYIYGRDRQYRYFLHFQPVAMAGYSIYIYHITGEDANRVRAELGLPQLTENIGFPGSDPVLRCETENRVGPYAVRRPYCSCRPDGATLACRPNPPAHARRAGTRPCPGNRGAAKPAVGWHGPEALRRAWRLAAILKKELKLDRSLAEIHQILSATPSR